MKKNIINTMVCATIMIASNLSAEDKAITIAKKDTSTQQVKQVSIKETIKPKNLSPADIINNDITVNASIAFVGALDVMGEGNSGKDYRQNIENERNVAMQEVQEESKKFEKAKSDYMAKATTMSDAAREKEEKKLIKMERDIKNLVAEKEEELKLSMQLATEALAQELEAAVTVMAQNENIDVVFDKMTGRAIYVSDKFDYTAKAIKEVNKNYEIKLAQNAQQAEAIKVAENKTPAAKSVKANA